jgi:hypothetical protein
MKKMKRVFQNVRSVYINHTLLKFKSQTIINQRFYATTIKGNKKKKIQNFISLFSNFLKCYLKILFIYFFF